MKQILTTIWMFILVSVISSNAQSWKLARYEFVGGIGSTHMFDDFTGTSSVDNQNLFGIKDLTVSDTRPSLLLAARYKLSNRISVRLNTVFGVANTQKGDSIISDMNLIEISPQVEYYFLKEERGSKSAAMYNRRGMSNNYSTLSSYLFAGVGGLYYKPQISFDGVSERTISGVSKAVYNDPAWTVVLPAGIGFKYILNGRYVLGLEVGGRYTFSDKINGYQAPSESLSKEVYPKGKTPNDLYYFTSLNISYKLVTSRNGLPLFLSKNRSRGSSGGVSGYKSPKAKSKKDAIGGSKRRRIKTRSYINNRSHFL